jgi:NADH-quinone oxidoreductase subunit L
MPPPLDQHPGLLFVVATLLPLASFVLILLSIAVKTWFRKSPEGSAGEQIYQFMGGPTPTRVAAYVATGAIGLACVCSVIGFVQYASHHSEHEAKEIKLEKEIHGLHDKSAHNKEKTKEDKRKASVTRAELATKEAELEELKSQWSGQLTWAAIYWWDKPEMEQKEPGHKEASHKEDAKGKQETHAEHDTKTRPATALFLGYRVDMLTALMFVMVTFIATLIHIFSMGYMADELSAHVADHQVHTAEGHLHRRGRFGRFFLYMSLFCFSMLNLVLADNLFQVFVSWELVGVCSYLLIGFYFERQSASNAANKAFITNRVGDAGFIIGLLILWTTLGTLNFEEIFAQVRAPLVDSHGHTMAIAGQITRFDLSDSKHPATGKPEDALRVNQESGSQVLLYKPEMHLQAEFLSSEKTARAANATGQPRVPSMPYWMLVVAGLGIFLGCVGKSAQFPLQVWLPDAMEGPTPVSALIHAATMVAAGVYLVGRCYPLFTAEVLLTIAYTGAITLFVAATIAIVMTDIKKVLAYSTVSQLGYMMLALGIGGWVAGLFHLITHAFFKALLFLCSGSVIYGCHHEQEMTKMGGLLPKMKITGFTMLTGVLAIAGIPFFSGWYSKDAILAQAFGFAAVHKQHFLLLVLPVLTAGITTFYMARMWFMTFTGKPRDEHVYQHAHEAPWLMTIPLVVLAVFSVIVAWGWPVWDAEKSALEHHVHHAQHVSVIADFGFVKETDARWDPFATDPRTGAPGTNVLLFQGETLKEDVSVRFQAQKYHFLIGNITLAIVIVALVLAASVYYFNLLDPADAMEQFPRVYDFLANKWYFDNVYSVLLVRPALIVASWCRWFDTKVIDGVVDGTARAGVQTSRASGRFDNGVVDGLVNVIADACWSVGAWLRNVQTGYLRSYVLFLVLAAVGIWVILSSLLGAAPAR